MTQANPPSPQSLQPLLSEQEARLRAELYLQQRVDYQDDYYERRIAEFNFNSDRMMWISALLMGVSTIISAYSVMSDEPLYAFVTALLPTIATALAAFRSLYQWQRQAQLYEDSWLALQQAKLVLPDSDFIQPGEYALYFPELVRQSEEVLRAEASQWGQLDKVATEDATGTSESKEEDTPP
ncbi:MAG: SLATT domain-containing protein, partial [Chloroflexi bacterium]